MNAAACVRFSPSRTALTFLSFGLAYLLLACTTAPPPPPKPVFRVAVQEFPSPGIRLIVLRAEKPPVYFSDDELHTAALHAATMWFQQHNLFVVDRGSLGQARREQALSLAGDDSRQLRAGRLVGAQQLVLFKVGAEALTIRAISTETGQVLWSAEGVAPPLPRQSNWRQAFGLDGTNDSTSQGYPVSRLVRQTLDAVWASRLASQ
jgi:hypothetical protein